MQVMRTKLIILVLLVATGVSAQLLPDRYRETITNTVTVTRNVKFSTGVPQPTFGGGFYEFVSGLPVNADESDTDPVDLYMDIFVPTGDTLTQRPVAIVAFGGGFLDGTRDHWSMEQIAIQLAARGYVAATMDYRLGMNIFDEDVSIRAVYRGLQDGRSAVRFFRADAAGSNTYGVDPDHIYIGGHSAGGFVALHNLYLDKDVERPASTRTWFYEGNWLPDQGGLDDVGDNTTYSGHANGAFSLAGALGYTTLIEGGEAENTVMFHSTDDGTVPYTSGQPFSTILAFVIGDDLPDVFGSNAIASRFAAVGLDYQFYSYTSRGHDVHEASSTQLYSDIIPGITDYLHSRYLEPLPLTFVSDSLVCDVTDSAVYEVDGLAKYYGWQATGALGTATDSTSSTATVLWDDTAPSTAIEVTPYSRLLARGASTTLGVTLSEVDSVYLMQSGLLSWADPAIWMPTRIPTGCDHVVAGSVTPGTIVTVPSALLPVHQRIRSLTTTSSLEIKLSAGSTLHIKD